MSSSRSGGGGGTIPSVYSHSHAPTTVSVSAVSSRARSRVGLLSTRSAKSLKVPWYKRSFVTQWCGVDVQRLSLYASFYSFFIALFTIIQSSFDIYCLSEATPGTTHYGYYIITFDFVYVGNRNVRNCLMAIAVLSLMGALVLFITSLQLIQALRNEYEGRMVPWLTTMAVFGVWRCFGLIFGALVNDMIFAYNSLSAVLWVLFTLINLGAWLAVYSLFLQLSDLTTLEDYAHLRMDTLSSLHGTHSMSMGESRPLTPHSYTPTTPIP